MARRSVPTRSRCARFIRCVVGVERLNRVPRRLRDHVDPSASAPRADRAAGGAGRRFVIERDGALQELVCRQGLGGGREGACARRGSPRVSRDSTSTRTSVRASIVATAPAPAPRREHGRRAGRGVDAGESAHDAGTRTGGGDLARCLRSLRGAAPRAQRRGPRGRHRPVSWAKEDVSAGVGARAQETRREGSAASRRRGARPMGPRCAERFVRVTCACPVHAGRAAGVDFLLTGGAGRHA